MIIRREHQSGSITPDLNSSLLRAVEMAEAISKLRGTDPLGAMANLGILARLRVTTEQVREVLKKRGL